MLSAAIFAAKSRFFDPSMCSATYFAVEIAGQEDELWETLKVTSAGFDPSEVIEVAVKPTGFPDASLVVITATPEAWRLKATLRASPESGFRLGSSIYFRVVEILGLSNRSISSFPGSLSATRRISDKFANMPLKPQDIGTEERKVSTSSGRLSGNSAKIQPNPVYLREKGISS